MSDNSYDQVAYQSRPFGFTHPNHLFAIARLFGLQAADFRDARVLELGCASGGNIIPLAMRYPDSTITGIDLSQGQTDAGRAMIEALGLENIELRQGSILDLPGNQERFDYIICHGVYSWVSAEVQQAILQTCQQQLSDNGVAIISYNTLPGWSSIKSLREMMLWHTRGIDDPKKRSVQAVKLLEFIRQGQGEQQSPYREIIESELKHLDGKEMAYVLHEYLEESNTPFYLHQFVAAAQAHELQYLADTALPRMFLGNQPPEVAALLGQTGDLIKTEQYMDFLNNRRFRTSLLCRSGVTLDRSITPDRLVGLAFRSRVRCSLPLDQITLPAEQELLFEGDQGLQVRTGNSGCCAFLLTLQQRGFEQFDVIVEEASERFGIPGQEIREQILRELLNFIFKGIVEIDGDAWPRLPEPTPTPRVWSLARYQAPRQRWVSNRAMGTLRINNIQRLLIELMDGNNSLSEIQAQLIGRLERNELGIQDADGKPITEPAAQLNWIRECLKVESARFHSLYLLDG